MVISFLQTLLTLLKSKSAKLPSRVGMTVRERRHFDWFYSIFETATEETKQNLSFEILQERTTAVTVSQQCLQAEKARSTRDHKFCRFLPTPTLSFVESTNLRLLAYTRRKPELSCATTAYYHLVPFVP
jgi:hypothetical protein